MLNKEGAKNLHRRNQRGKVIFKIRTILGIVQSWIVQIIWATLKGKFHEGRKKTPSEKIIFEGFWKVFFV